MRRVYWPALLMSLALLAPIVPFVWFGDEFERQLTAFFDPPPPAGITAAALAAVMATDIFLPVPSSLLTAIAGAQLGHQLGAPVGLAIAVSAAWIGLTLGGCIGFYVTRRWGRGVAARFASNDDLERMDRLADRYGVLAIIISRPLPLLAEATVLVLGTTSLAWRRFLPTLVLSNLGLGIGYAAVGYVGRQQGQLVWALVASVAVPAIATESLD